MKKTITDFLASVRSGTDTRSHEPEYLHLGRPHGLSNQVLLASAREDDRNNLHGILDGSAWHLTEVCGWSAAVKALESSMIPVVLVDRHLAGYHWLDGVRYLVGTPCRPAVILLSSVIDPYLWEELVKTGGFDVLTRPFQSDQVLSMISFAHTHWKTGWPRRAEGRFESIA